MHIYIIMCVCPNYPPGSLHIIAKSLSMDVHATMYMSTVYFFGVNWRTHRIRGYHASSWTQKHLHTFVYICIEWLGIHQKNWLYHQQCDMWFCPRLEDTSIYVSSNMCFLTMRFGVHDLRTKSYHCDSAPNMICVRVCLHINCSRMRSDHGCMHAIFLSRVSMNIHEQHIPDEQGNAHGNLVMMCKHNV